MIFFIKDKKIHKEGVFWRMWDLILIFSHSILENIDLPNFEMFWVTQLFSYGNFPFFTENI
ncbi:hypothetical protein M153_533000470 [Pseudoloma neurophilia]|uniref:Uncharacterized protein n=1 Tax=Pseudoloma neurophilia TaxID=146866 RepID=A0A0R0LWW1_9MICR|nr:hypothetical protein M153_533000470 [Pseudoloma neurophilia]